MKFSEQWLREWVDPAVDTATLSHQLTMAGLEVDAVEPVAAEFSNVVVGEVLKVEPHPDADRLRVCEVNVGNEKLSIVCGAPNVAVGLKVPAALIGAVLPNGMKIKKSKLRGVESHGMLCSAVELGMAETSDGLMLLPGDAVPGQNVRELLSLDDVSIEIGLTPNRGDCLSVAGIAGEVAVANQVPVNELQIADVVITHQDTLPIRLSAPEACPRYIGRVIKGVNPKAETPLWMRERLRRSGLRSISPIVDVTNYVMLELGQPMHAFDLAKLTGGIEVRMAGEGEKITLLDGQELTLQANTLVIADQQAPVAVAGIMGGVDSSVTDETADLFLESAFFAPEAIVGRARRYGLHTDSSHRFERGVDFKLPARAMRRATMLLKEIVGGEAEYLPRREAISLRVERIKRLLGIDLPLERVSDILTSLGMQVVQQGKTWLVTPPSSRFDLAIEADLIEEVGRVYGYDELPTEAPRVPMVVELPREARVPLSRVRTFLVDRGYQEAITYSFVDQEIQQLLEPELEAVALANPISAEMSVMRTTLWSGLLQAVRYNQNRQQERIRIFECGVKYLKHGDETREIPVVAGVVTGNLLPEQWGSNKQAVDFFDVKADVEGLLELTGRKGEYMFAPGRCSALHSGQSAAIKTSAEVPIGWVGKLHPQIEKRLGFNGSVYLFEVIQDVFADAVKPEFHELSKFPSVRRDLAIVVDTQVTAQQVKECVAGISGEYLEEFQLFDVYCGEGIESGRKSLALGLTFQDLSRTLKDTEVDALVAGILDKLKQELHATLRE
jgi:phenylalanyl-tRNA synthetase beta chain